MTAYKPQGIQAPGKDSCAIQGSQNNYYWYKKFWQGLKLWPTVTKATNLFGFGTYVTRNKTQDIFPDVLSLVNKCK